MWEEECCQYEWKQEGGGTKNCIHIPLKCDMRVDQLGLKKLEKKRRTDVCVWVKEINLMQLNKWIRNKR